MSEQRVTFNVRRDDEWVRVTIEGDYATIWVSGIDDVWPVYTAINRAVGCRGQAGSVVHRRPGPRSNRGEEYDA
jgi:hypothetical protein